MMLPNNNHNKWFPEIQDSNNNRNNSRNNNLDKDKEKPRKGLF
jgi:hypothetical protein